MGRGRGHLLGGGFQAEAVAEQVALLADKPPPEVVGAAVGQAQHEVGDDVLAVRLAGFARAQVLAGILLGLLLPVFRKL